MSNREVNTFLGLHSLNYPKAGDLSTFLDLRAPNADLLKALLLSIILPTNLLTTSLAVC